MKFNLYKVSGYEEAIMALRMSKGKFYNEGVAKDIRELVWLVTDARGLLCDEYEYTCKWASKVTGNKNKKVTGVYEEDVAEFKRLLGLTFDDAMGTHKHHTLMKYIDVSFFTEGLHRGAADALDSHAIAFNNRITRYSTRLADIEETPLSDWYKDKLLTFDQVNTMLEKENNQTMPDWLEVEGERFIRTPWGYVIEKHATMPAKNGLSKDVQRGLMPLGLESSGLWKIDFANLRYVYKMRSKLTKASPELKLGMEMLADQVEQIPVFGEYFRKELTDSGEWEHLNKVKTIGFDEYQEFKRWKAGKID